jgi:hypothetical protein
MLVYLAVIILSVMAVGLVKVSPPDFTKNKVVYGGF